MIAWFQNFEQFRLRGNDPFSRNVTGRFIEDEEGGDTFLCNEGTYNVTIGACGSGVVTLKVVGGNRVKLNNLGAGNPPIFFDIGPDPDVATTIDDFNGSANVTLTLQRFGCNQIRVTAGPPVSCIDNLEEI